MPARRGALQYDLLRAGLTLDDLGSEAFSWYDLRVFTRHIQAQHDSALGTELRGYPAWSVESQLLAHLVDLTAAANWQRAGKKNAPKPKPIERPGGKPGAQHFGSDPLPVDDFNAWWDSAGRS